MKKSDCLSAWQLDRLYLQGEQLPDKQRLRQHLASCETCQQQYQMRQQHAEELRAQSGYQALLQRGIERLEVASSPTSVRRTVWDVLWSWRGLSWAAALTAVVVAVVWLPFSPDPPQRLGKTDGMVVRMLHFRKGSQYSQWTRDGEMLTPGALVQFYYQLPQDRHVMIVSLDQKGTVSAFFPLHQAHSVVRRAGTGTLPPNHSLELDDNVGQERIFVIAAPHPFTLTAVKQALYRAFADAEQDLAKLKEMPRPWQSVSILIRKHKEDSLLIPQHRSKTDEF